MKPFNAFAAPDSQKAQANKREKQLAKRVGGRVHPCSGALAGFKGDLSTKEFLFDSKGTEADSTSVKLADLMKITREANTAVKHPALILSFNTTGRREDWVLIPMEVFNKLAGT